MNGPRAGVPGSQGLKKAEKDEEAEENIVLKGRPHFPQIRIPAAVVAGLARKFGSAEITSLFHRSLPLSTPVIESCGLSNAVFFSFSFSRPGSGKATSPPGIFSMSSPDISRITYCGLKILAATLCFTILNPRHISNMPPIQDRSNQTFRGGFQRLATALRAISGLGWDKQSPFDSNPYGSLVLNRLRCFTIPGVNRWIYGKILGRTALHEADPDPSKQERFRDSGQGPTQFMESLHFL